MSVQTQLEAYAFRELVSHLQNNNDVQNIDIMNLAGFCRNCLSKWYYAAAKQLGFAITYDEACEVVYGMPYADWKKKYQTKATEEQMRLFNENKHRHAKHDSNLLPTSSKKSPSTQSPAPATTTETKTISQAKSPAPSSACCDPAGVTCAEDLVSKLTNLGNRNGNSTDVTQVKLGVATVSDRASSGVYEDLSGPECQKCVELFGSATNLLNVSSTVSKLVPDESDKIQEAIRSLSQQGCNLILTTGGTGLSSRDVTPEATRAVIDRVVPGITEAVRRETSRVEPLASLSRAVSGILNQSLVINLPGRPKAVREALGVIFPVLPHALSELSRPQTSA